MALVNCAECDAEISDKALACPACGAPQKKSRSVLPVLLSLIGLAVLAFVILAAVGSRQASTAAARTSPSASILADSEVQLGNGAYGCAFSATVESAKRHYELGEYSAWASESGGPLCFNHAPSELKWTVLQIRGDFAQVGFASLAQYDAAHKSVPDMATEKYWVPLSFLLPASP
ncbi:hypothetical protein C8J98_104236 [Luteibacter sp. OK325]|nr:hypothetical protein C8J98_104236 [Luteibacter sp. OK325]